LFEPVPEERLDLEVICVGLNSRSDESTEAFFQIIRPAVPYETEA
jgi:hypothetical protein